MLVPARYREIFAEIWKRLWVRLALPIWAVICTYDTVLSQLIPEEYSRQLPKTWQVAIVTGGLLPLWAWLLILAAIITVASLEYALRSSRLLKGRANANQPVTAQQAPHPIPSPTLTEYEREQRLKALDEIFECLIAEVNPAYMSGHILNSEWISELRANGPRGLAAKLEAFRVMADKACGKLSELIVEKYGYLADFKADIKWNVAKLNENTRRFINKLNDVGDGNAASLVELLRDHDVLKDWSKSVLELSGMIENNKEIIIAKRKAITGSDSAQSEHQAIEQLKRYATEYSNIKIQFANISHKPIAERLKSWFELAGWHASPLGLPLEQYVLDHYFTGIEVTGYNSQLVDVVQTAIRFLGRTDITSKVEELHIKRDNPKWPSCNQSIRVTIGHQVFAGKTIDISDEQPTVVMRSFLKPTKTGLLMIADDLPFRPNFVEVFRDNELLGRADRVGQTLLEVRRDRAVDERARLASIERYGHKFQVTAQFTTVTGATYWLDVKFSR